MLAFCPFCFRVLIETEYQQKGHPGTLGKLDTVKPRKLEHHSPPALKVKYKESQHESS